jgi:hypothetical protein
MTSLPYIFLSLCDNDFANELNDFARELLFDWNNVEKVTHRFLESDVKMMAVNYVCGIMTYYHKLTEEEYMERYLSRRKYLNDSLTVTFTKDFPTGIDHDGGSVVIDVFQNQTYRI